MKHVRTNYKKRIAAVAIVGLSAFGVTTVAAQSSAQAPVSTVVKSSPVKSNVNGIKAGSVKSNVNGIKTGSVKSYVNGIKTGSVKSNVNGIKAGSVKSNVNGISVKLEKKPTFVNGI